MWLFYYFLLYFNLIFYEGINSLLKYAIISLLSIYLFFIIILVYDSYSSLSIDSFINCHNYFNLLIEI